MTYRPRTFGELSNERPRRAVKPQGCVTNRRGELQTAGGKHEHLREQVSGVSTLVPGVSVHSYIQPHDFCPRFFARAKTTRRGRDPGNLARSEVQMCTVAMLVSVGVVSGYDCCWCDKDTPASKHKIMFENTPMQLVFSDDSSWCAAGANWPLADGLRVCLDWDTLVLEEVQGRP